MSIESWMSQKRNTYKKQNLIISENLSYECIFYLPIFFDFGEKSFGEDWEIPMNLTEQEIEDESWYPLYNYIYCLPDTFQVPDDWRDKLEGMTIITVNEKYFLGLTSVGQDNSWGICQTYVNLGYFPPIVFSDLPLMSGRGISSKDRRLISLCKESFYYAIMSCKQSLKDMVTKYKRCSAYYTIFLRTKEGVIERIYGSQKGKHLRKKKSWKSHLYSFEKFKEWCLSQNKFHVLFDKWVKSGYRQRLKPSVDRIDCTKGYIFSNIQLMTWGENSDKGRIEYRIHRGKKVVQKSKKGKRINEFKSITEASKKTGIRKQQISGVANKNPLYKSVGGFLWEFVEKYPREGYWAGKNFKGKKNGK